MALRKHVVATLVAATSALSFGLVQAAEVGAAGAHVERVYGRAGVAALGAHAGSVTVTYSDEVAARTNMATDRARNARIGVTQNAEVAARTNMPLDTKGEVFAETRPGRS
ncbi:MAG: hypothetical protein IT532_08115 [Burkholderiales bacterium]|nr:hypothetical protein [Burkholderiales bacterium]